MPENTLNILNLNKYKLAINGQKALEQAIFYKLRCIDIDKLSTIYEVTEGLENRIKNAIFISKSYDELIENIKSKRYTESKIRRILLNILLDITKKDMASLKKAKPFIRILGFNDNGKLLISEIAKANPKLDIVISVAQFEKNLTNKDKRNILAKDILATDLYTLTTNATNVSGLDFTTKVVYIDDEY